MSEISMPTKTQFSATYLPLFLFLSYCLISKLTYFLPYLLNLLHFLSPLLITTFLVFLFTSYKTFIEKTAARSNHAGEHEKEEHEVYKIFFEAASQFELQQDDSTEESQELVDKFLICVNDATEDRNPPPEKTLEELFQEKKQSCETVSDLQVVSEDEKEIGTDSKNVVRESKEEFESDIKLSVIVSDKECVSRTFLQDKSTKVVESEKMSMMSVGSYGSMRVDKEWKRTLACKLFEERHNNNGNAGVERDEEGMDLLWEAYEDNSSSAKHATGQKKRLEKKRSVGSAKSLRYKDTDAVDEEDDDDEEEEDIGGKICCLQALKFSAGKVNLGMGRPNIGRISKAFRGVGWLHHVSSKKGSSPLKPKVLFGN